MGKSFHLHVSATSLEQKWAVLYTHNSFTEALYNIVKKGVTWREHINAMHIKILGFMVLGFVIESPEVIKLVHCLGWRKGMIVQVFFNDMKSTQVSLFDIP